MNEGTQETSVSGAGMDRRVERSKHWWRNRRVRWIGGVAAALLAAMALYAVVPASDSLAVEADAIRTGAVERASFQDYVPLRAQVAPLHTTFVAAIAGGQVEQVIASDGARVAKGQPLAKLANRQLELEVASRSADIAGQLGSLSGQRLSIQRNRLESDRQVADAQNALQKAEAELAKKRILLKKGIVNDAAVAPLRDEVTYQRDRVRALTEARAAERGTLSDQSAQIGATASQLHRSMAMVGGNLDALVIRAPAAGRLTDFDLQPGQTLKEGERVAQVGSTNAWKLTADVDQFYLGRVERGQRVIADIDGKSARLHVTKVLPQVTEGRFRVELGFDDAPPAGLNRGQTIDVRLVLGADQPAVVAPNGGWIDAGGSTAFVLSADGDRAVRRTISTGRRNPEQVEVTDGLKPGERIVTSSLDAYQPYSTLIIR